MVDKMNYVYNCNGQEKILTDNQETKVEHGRYFFVVCSVCCNVPVYHMLDRKDILMNKKLLSVENTKAALLELEKAEKAFSKGVDTLETNLDILSLLHTVEEAEKDVRRSFYEDSKDRNTLDNCMLVSIDWLREMVAKHERASDE
jgi:hypothetical protein